MREVEDKRIHRSKETRNHPSNSILPKTLHSDSTGGGVGGMSLPLSLEIVATDISQVEAGSSLNRMIACRPVANDSPYSKAGKLILSISS